MDQRNLIYGQPPEIGNPFHIEQYKIRAMRAAGDLPVIIRYSFYSYDYGRVYGFRCPKCGSLIETRLDCWNECYGHGCDKEFELRPNDKNDFDVFVVKKVEENIT